jgi:hypothetical protein
LLIERTFINDDWDHIDFVGGNVFRGALRESRMVQGFSSTMIEVVTWFYCFRLWYLDGPPRVADSKFGVSSAQSIVKSCCPLDVCQ